MQNEDNHETNVQALGVVPKRRGPKPGFKRPQVQAAPVKMPVAAEAVAVDTAETTADASLAVDSSRSDYAAEVERIRSIRKPFGSFMQKLALPVRPGYHRHWFNDTPGRIDEAKASGWVHIVDQGKPIKRVVGAGRERGGLYAYAMEIPIVFWDEDQQRHHERAFAVMNEIKTSPVRARPGEVKKSDREKFYTPREVTIEKD